MEYKNWWDEDLDRNLRDELRIEVIQALENAESKPIAEYNVLFDDVYENKTNNLLRQEHDLKLHIEKHPSFYRK
jgi:TPP-dependent pyruvate/acetoin dehydrogenase alpha subunit